MKKNCHKKQNHPINIYTLVKRRIVRSYTDNTRFSYSVGRFDNYHLMYEKGNYAYDLFDKAYLKRIKQIANNFGKNRVYNDFIKIVNLVVKTANKVNLNTKNVKPQKDDFKEIEEISRSYSKNKYNQLRINKLFDCLYLAMIAEWHWRGSKLKHRLKHLAVYQVIYQNMTPQDAACYSKGQSYRQLDNEMKKYNI